MMESELNKRKIILLTFLLIVVSIRVIRVLERLKILRQEEKTCEKIFCIMIFCKKTLMNLVEISPHDFLDIC